MPSLSEETGGRVSMMMPGSGATQYSQGAGGYTASVTYGSALGEMYLGKTDLKRLGLNAQVRRVLHPLERGEVE